MKISIFLTLLLILSISSLSANGELEQNSSKMEHHSSNMEHDPSRDLSELLKDEEESRFFTNQKSGDFHENFLRKATLEPTNSIRIKAGTSVFWTMNPMNTFSDNVAIDALVIGGFSFSSLRKKFTLFLKKMLKSIKK